ncbi:transcriptional regulator [Breznakiella homolactica]|uniref:Transcriptional regulator n=1 Tax=Breznakiella homolactica TaxID=2798577 RepID=A0A7T7XKG0_9SPIR|nr:transcriptional regulator [Breznakiella homolactica]QQO08049.1 transcriptional regulator [Breznakiella homolactica]
MENEPTDPEYIILESIYDSSNKKTPLRQRELAHIAGASLGMANSILKRLIKKGWVSVKKINSRNIQYAITLDGINEIARRSYGYFKRTIKNVVFYKNLIDTAVGIARERGKQTVLLVGISDLDFIVEHSCSRHGISLVKAIDRETADAAVTGNTFTIFAENISEPGTRELGEVFYLSKMVTGTGQGE